MKKTILILLLLLVVGCSNTVDMGPDMMDESMIDEMEEMMEDMDDEMQDEDMGPDMMDDSMIDEMDEMMGDSPQGHGSPMMGSQEKYIVAPNLNIDDLPLAKSTTIVDLKDGDQYTITSSIVKKTIQGKEVKMYAYNEQIPGVALRVNQGSTVEITFKNEIDQPTTIHWHGLRHDVKFDGVPGISQKEVLPGEIFKYEVYFPDEGIYWYHPHVREDIQQDLGLAGNMLVKPESNYASPVDREELIILDDIKMNSKGVVPFGKEHVNHAIMGRYGNVMLTNGQEKYDLEVVAGDVVRFYVTNVANARPFNFKIEGAKMKLIGGDLGRFEQEEFIDSIIVAPAERYILEVYFENAGEYVVLNDEDVNQRVLGSIKAIDAQKLASFANEFNTLNQNQKMIAEVNKYEQFFNKEADYTLELDFEMHGMKMDMMRMAMGESHEEIEWDDDMGMMNTQSTSETVRWIIRDEKTGLENDKLTLQAKVGDVKKIKFKNLDDSMHPMQHPMHLHGQRFLVLSINGKEIENKAWKDTVLVPIGQEAEILVDITNPGEWVMHCHIAEHMHSGMMISMMVEE